MEDGLQRQMIEAYNRIYAEGGTSDSPSVMQALSVVAALLIAKGATNVLDLGSGVIDPLTLARSGLTVRAIDLSPVAVEMLNQVAQIEDLSLVAEVADVTRPISGSDYSAVLMTWLFHHLTRAEVIELLARAQAQTAPGGFHIVAAYTTDSDFYRLGAGGGFYLADQEQLVDGYSGWDPLVCLTAPVSPSNLPGAVNWTVLAVFQKPA